MRIGVSDELTVEIARLTIENETLRCQLQEAHERLRELEELVARRKALKPETEDEEKASNAIECLAVVMAETSSLSFATAVELITAGGSKHAATALARIMREYAVYLEAEGVAKAAGRVVRDLLVVELRSQVRPKDRDAFFKAAEEALLSPTRSRYEESGFTRV